MACHSSEMLNNSSTLSPVAGYPRQDAVEGVFSSRWTRTRWTLSPLPALVLYFAIQLYLALWNPGIFWRCVMLNGDEICALVWFVGDILLIRRLCRLCVLLVGLFCVSFFCGVLRRCSCLNSDKIWCWLLVVWTSRPSCGCIRFHAACDWFSCRQQPI